MFSPRSRLRRPGGFRARRHWRRAHCLQPRHIHERGRAEGKGGRAVSEGQGAGGARGRHTLMMTGRERLELEGVQRVDSFDDKAVVLDTDLGRMTIRGENLHIHELNLEDGRLLLEGRITSLAYEDTGSGRRERRNLLERLLK